MIQLYLYEAKQPRLTYRYKGQKQSMFNIKDIANNAFAERLKKANARNFSRQNPDYPDIITWVERMSLERIAASDALLI